MIKIRNLCKSFGERTVLRDFSADIAQGRTTVLAGKSGVGKTTLLRILAGLETADSGTIEGVDGSNVSMVFQEDRLCRRISASANIQMVCGLSRDEIKAHLADIGIDEIAAKSPVSALSGGQARRVALLRGLLYPAGVILLDEPFKGLDSETREMVLRCYEQLRMGRTAILVSHDAQDIPALGADILKM